MPANRDRHIESPILRMNDLLRYTSLSRATIYNLRQRNDFPQPFMLSDVAKGWYRSEVDEWLANRPRTNLES